MRHSFSFLMAVLIAALVTSPVHAQNANAAAQGREPFNSRGMRLIGVAVEPATSRANRASRASAPDSDSDFGRFTQLIGLRRCSTGCFVLAVNGKNFDGTYHDEPLLQILKHPSTSPITLRVVIPKMYENIDAEYDVSFESWDARIESIFLPHVVVLYYELQLTTISPDSLLDEIRTQGGNNPSKARELAAKSQAFYPSSLRVSNAQAALKEVLDKETTRRFEQAQLLDSQNDWSGSSNVLKQMLIDIPESKEQVAKLLDGYYQRGLEAEAQQHWESAASLYAKTLDIFPEQEQAQTHLEACRGEAVKQCLSDAQELETHKRFQAGLERLDKCLKLFPDDKELKASGERLADASGKEHERFADASKRERERLVDASKRERAHQADAAFEHKLQDALNLSTRQLDSRQFTEAGKSVADLVLMDSADPRVKVLSRRAAREIPPSAYENYMEAERVIGFGSPVTPDSAARSLERGVRVDWHGVLETKTIDNWYVVTSPVGAFVFKRPPGTTGGIGQEVRIIGIVQGTERISTLGSAPKEMVVLLPERID
jgi:tetratricopeptide (TPR) repeat protein